MVFRTTPETTSKGFGVRLVNILVNMYMNKYNDVEYCTQTHLS